METVRFGPSAYRNKNFYMRILCPVFSQETKVALVFCIPAFIVTYDFIGCP